MVHITGGGMTENIPRVIPKGLGVNISTKAWTVRAPGCIVGRFQAGICRGHQLSAGPACRACHGMLATRQIALLMQPHACVRACARATTHARRARDTVYPSLPQLPPLFQWVQEKGSISDAEMRRTFNCGVGLIAVVSPSDVDKALAAEPGGRRAWLVHITVESYRPLLPCPEKRRRCARRAPSCKPRPSHPLAPPKPATQASSGSARSWRAAASSTCDLARSGEPDLA